MSVESVTCAECGAELPPSSAGAEHREPCEQCGGTKVVTAVTLTPAVEVDTAVAGTIGTTNTAAARKRQLESAIADVEEAVRSRTIGQAQANVKRALEPIHELADCLRRGEWSQAGWDANARGCWHGHLGARNATHHFSSSSIVALHPDGPADDQLVWAIEPAAINSIRSWKQAAEYSARLHGRPVLPLLRQMAALVSSAIP